MQPTFKLIITGATGMVGEGVLHECLRHEAVEEILSISRKPCGITHPKLKEIIHADFFNLASIRNQLAGYDACFFCLGVSSVGMKEETYFHLTFELTVHVADTLCAMNPNMTFCYISGAGTDSTMKGRMMWARVKGKTEHYLQDLPFKSQYNFRPGILVPGKGLKHTLPAYRYAGWLLPVIRVLFPKYVCTLQELGLAMIHSVLYGYEKTTLEVPDILRLSKTQLAM
jgi:uncharacterized protein YbjT (DUF2867 family)